MGKASLMTCRSSRLCQEIRISECMWVETRAVVFVCLLSSRSSFIVRSQVPSTSISSPLALSRLVPPLGSFRARPFSVTKLALMTVCEVPVSGVAGNLNSLPLSLDSQHHSTGVGWFALAVVTRATAVCSFVSSSPDLWVSSSSAFVFFAEAFCFPWRQATVLWPCLPHVEQRTLS